jgi:hypothetical protein
MSAEQQAVAVSKKQIWTGRVLSAVPFLMLVFSGIMKLVKPPMMVQSFAHFGLPIHLAVPLGILEISCAVVYLIPRTSVLGAILVAAYLGGATATNVRIGDPWILPVLLGMLAWAGLFLRDRRLRVLIPLRSLKSD